MECKISNFIPHTLAIHDLYSNPKQKCEFMLDLIKIIYIRLVMVGGCLHDLINWQFFGLTLHDKLEDAIVITSHTIRACSAPNSVMMTYKSAATTTLGLVNKTRSEMPLVRYISLSYLLRIICLV